MQQLGCFVVAERFLVEEPANRDHGRALCDDDGDEGEIDLGDGDDEHEDGADRGGGEHGVGEYLQLEFAELGDSVLVGVVDVEAEDRGGDLADDDVGDADEGEDGDDGGVFACGVDDDGDDVEVGGGADTEVAGVRVAEVDGEDDDGEEDGDVEEQRAAHGGALLAGEQGLCVHCLEKCVCRSYKNRGRAVVGCRPFFFFCSGQYMHRHMLSAVAMIARWLYILCASYVLAQESTTTTTTTNTILCNADGFTVEAGASMLWNCDAALQPGNIIVNAGGTLVVNGLLNISGIMIVNGPVTNNEIVGLVNHGVITITGNVTIIGNLWVGFLNNGTVIVEPDGTLDIQGMLASENSTGIVNYGHINVYGVLMIANGGLESTGVANAGVMNVYTNGVLSIANNNIEADDDEVVGRQNTFGMFTSGFVNVYENGTLSIMNNGTIGMVNFGGKSLENGTMNGDTDNSSGIVTVNGTLSITTAKGVGFGNLNIVHVYGAMLVATTPTPFTNSNLSSMELDIFYTDIGLGNVGALAIHGSMRIANIGGVGVNNSGAILVGGTLSIVTPYGIGLANTGTIDVNGTIFVANTAYYLEEVIFVDIERVLNAGMVNMGTLTVYGGMTIENTGERGVVNGGTLAIHGEMWIKNVLGIGLFSYGAIFVGINGVVSAANYGSLFIVDTNARNVDIVSLVSELFNTSIGIYLVGSMHVDGAFYILNNGTKSIGLLTEGNVTVNGTLSIENTGGSIGVMTFGLIYINGILYIANIGGFGIFNGGDVIIRASANYTDANISGYNESNYGIIRVEVPEPIITTTAALAAAAESGAATMETTIIALAVAIPVVLVAGSVYFAPTLLAHVPFTKI